MIGLFARGLAWAVIWTLLVLAVARPAAKPQTMPVPYGPTPAGPFLPYALLDRAIRSERDS